MNKSVVIEDWLKSTRAAWPEYEKRMLVVDAAYYNARTNSQVYEAVAKEKAAALFIQEAFFLDTRGLNSWENCQHVHPLTLKKWLAGPIKLVERDYVTRRRLDDVPSLPITGEFNGCL